MTQLQEFSYTVSHDLRAPLRAITGYINVLSEDCGVELPAVAQKYLEKIGRKRELDWRLCARPLRGWVARLEWKETSRWVAVFGLN